MALVTRLAYAVFLCSTIWLAKFKAHAAPQTSYGSSSNCRCFPRDACWPLDQDWNDFNQTLNGRLIKTVPIASACHDSHFAPYDAQKCASLKSVWELPETHYTDSASIMQPYFQNSSCDPFLDRGAQCWSSGTRDTIFFGRSTGAGSLALWTHHLKTIEFLDGYKSPGYSGKAIKVGAGVQFFEAQKEAHARGLVIVSGYCPTVGLAGGFSQGGGLGLLASKFGLGADQVLEWEVVTASGELFTASPSKNSDLYWALTGGGGGTYGAVLSMAAKVYPDLRTSAANLTFISQGLSEKTFDGAVQDFLTALPSIVDAGAVSYWFITNTSFTMLPTTAPGLSKAKLQALMDPVLDKLKQRKIPYRKRKDTNLVLNISVVLIHTEYFIDEYPTFLDSNILNPPQNLVEYSEGGRFIPRSAIASPASVAALTKVLRSIANSGPGALVSGASINVAQGGHKSTNSVNPGFRDMLFNLIFGLYVAHVSLSPLPLQVFAHARRHNE